MAKFKFNIFSELILAVFCFQVSLIYSPWMYFSIGSLKHAFSVGLGLPRMVWKSRRGCLRGLFPHLSPLARGTAVKCPCCFHRTCWLTQTSSFLLAPDLEAHTAWVPAWSMPSVRVCPVPRVCPASETSSVKHMTDWAARRRACWQQWWSMVKAHDVAIHSGFLLSSPKHDKNHLRRLLRPLSQPCQTHQQNTPVLCPSQPWPHFWSRGVDLEWPSSARALKAAGHIHPVPPFVASWGFRKPAPGIMCWGTRTQFENKALQEWECVYTCATLFFNIHALLHCFSWFI